MNTQSFSLLCLYLLPLDIFQTRAIHKPNPPDQNRLNLHLIRRHWLSMVGVQTQQRLVKWWVSSKIKLDSIRLWKPISIQITAQIGGDLVISNKFSCISLHRCCSQFQPKPICHCGQLTQLNSFLLFGRPRVTFSTTWHDGSSSSWAQTPNLTQPVNTPISDFNLLLNLLYVDLQVWNCRLSYFKIRMESLAVCQFVLFWVLG